MMSNDVHHELRQCECEIAAIEAMLVGGHPDVAGLCLALSDWSAELRSLRAEVANENPGGGYFFGGL